MKSVEFERGHWLSTPQMKGDLCHAVSLSQLRPATGPRASDAYYSAGYENESVLQWSGIKNQEPSVRRMADNVDSEVMLILIQWLNEWLTSGIPPFVFIFYFWMRWASSTSSRNFLDESANSNRQDTIRSLPEMLLVIKCGSASTLGQKWIFVWILLTHHQYLIMGCEYFCWRAYICLGLHVPSGWLGEVCLLRMRKCEPDVARITWSFCSPVLPHISF